MHQSGDIPNRDFKHSPYNSFHHTAVYGSRLLAFGIVNDIGYSEDPQIKIALYQFDFCSGVWSHIQATGDLKLDNLLGLVVYDKILYALGWESNAMDEGVQVG